MPIDNHFNAEIINLDVERGSLGKNKNYFYDCLNINGIIELDELSFEETIKFKILHFFANENLINK